MRLPQRDGVSCGPTVAILARAVLDADYAARLDEPGWFADEQARLHRRLNRCWPRSLGTTPWAMARALSVPGTGYRWSSARHVVAAREAVLLGWPVAMLVGRRVPRHWVLLVEVAGPARDGMAFRCFEPSTGELRRVGFTAVRDARLDSVGFPRAFGFVLPSACTRTAARPGPHPSGRVEVSRAEQPRAGGRGIGDATDVRTVLERAGGEPAQSAEQERATGRVPWPQSVVRRSAAEPRGGTSDE